MREIKFRAWDAENNEMVYGVHLNDGKPVKPAYQWFNPQNTVHDSEPMQYTGLRDKNGVEIYEGDIVHVIEVSEHENSDFASPVEWIDYGWTLTDPNDTQWPLVTVDSSHNWVGSLSEIEVIGNIYEHPDLLREQTKGDHEQKEEHANQP